MPLKRRIYAVVTDTNEKIVIEDYRDFVNTSNGPSDVLGAKATLETTDGRKVQVKDERRVDVEALKGDWEVEDNGKWLPISSLSLDPPTK